MAWQGKPSGSRSAFGWIAAIAVQVALIAVLVTALAIRHSQFPIVDPIEVKVEDPDKTTKEPDEPIVLPERDQPTAKVDEPDEPVVIMGEPTKDPPLPGKNDSYPRPGANSGEPDYPPTERRLGHTGSVVLGLCVSAAGNVTAASVKISSGYPQLDQAALDWAKRIRWRPGTVEGRATDMCFEQPYRFVIKDQ